MLYQYLSIVEIKKLGILFHSKFYNLIDHMVTHDPALRSVNMVQEVNSPPTTFSKILWVHILEGGKFLIYYYLT
jgi:hypothetical protein